MTDEFDTLRMALKAAPPAPEEGRKAADLAAAMQAYDAENAPHRQGSAAPVRPVISRSIWARLAEGGTSMIHALTTRAGLAATTGLVTAGLAVILVLPMQDQFGPRGPGGEIALPDLRQEAESAGSRTDATSGRASQNQQDADAPPPAPMAVDALAQNDAFAGAAGPTADAGGTAALPPAPSLRLRRTAPEPVASDEPEPAPPVGLQAKTSGASVMESREIDHSLLLSDLAQTERAGESFLAPAPPPAVLTQGNTERFANAESNPLKQVASEPVSTFSVDVDTASYAVVRSSLMAGVLPPSEAVRVEEMVNYFPYDYPAPEAGGAPFRPDVTVTPTPWDDGTRIVRIGLQGMMPAVEDRPPLNLVFLIDTSGSMQDPSKLPLLKQSLRLMLGQLRPEDQLAIVTYAGSAGQVLAPTPAGERSTILAALDRLEAGGSTAGQAGLEQAYAVAEAMSGEGEVTRVLLATDGDFNVGISDPEALKHFVERKRAGGAYLSVLGFGRGNLNDALMQALAQNGNGQAAYIDTIAEAQKVLVDQLTGSLFPIAQDVKVQVEFNPASIAEYRLIGYETRALRREDFSNDRVDAGEIGAGHQVTALYEVTPVGSEALRNAPLRYQPQAETAEGGAVSDELGFLRLRYKAPGEQRSRLIEQPIPDAVAEPGTETRFATAIAGFGQLLRGSEYLGDWSYDEAIELAAGARGSDPYGYRAEAVQLMRLAGALAQ